MNQKVYFDFKNPPKSKEENAHPEIQADEINNGSIVSSGVDDKSDRQLPGLPDRPPATSTKNNSSSSSTKSDEVANNITNTTTQQLSDPWQNLELTLNQITDGWKLDGESILRLGRLYNACLADLSLIKKNDRSGQRVVYLNNLLVRAYLTIYRRPQVRLMDFVEFFLFHFPDLVWRRIHFVVVATLVFVFSTLIGFMCISNESKLVDLIIPKYLQEQARQDIGRGKLSNAPSLDNRMTISSKIMFNNIQVAFKAFALGILFGAGTIYILIINGMLLGGLAALYYEGGKSISFWALILPHGSIELSCCFIAGAAGLIIGYSIFSRTPYPRLSWMVHEALDAVKLIAGTIPWFVIAALIETYITPSKLSDMTKLSLSTIFFTCFLIYLASGITISTWQSKNSIKGNTR